MSVLMDDIEMILESNDVRSQCVSIKQVCYNSALLLLRTKPSKDDVAAIWHEPLFSMRVANDSVWLPARARPFEIAACKM